MKPKSSVVDAQDDLFKVRLADLINPDHALCRLANQLDWSLLEGEISVYFSEAGAPALPVRLMAGLLYLQHAFNVSDERVVEQWVESPYWQYFCGETFFQHKLPCDPTSLVRWRQRLGEEGCEWLLTATIQAGLSTKLVKPSSLKRIVLDTTVQEKNIAFPTDSKLYDTSRKQLVNLAASLGITLRQTYQKQARLLAQKKRSKNKLYSLHAPETECISKGKAHKRYEFGVKASFATTLRETFVVGARSFTGNPYDGHTLTEQLEQTAILCNTVATEVYVDRGYRGHRHPGDAKIILAGQKRGVSPLQKKRLNRRNTIEPIIGHMKQDGKLRRCFLKGAIGDAMNVILCGAGQNIRKLLKWLYWALLLVLPGLSIASLSNHSYGSAKKMMYLHFKLHEKAA